MTAEAGRVSAQWMVEAGVKPHRSWWYHAAYRFLRNRLSVVGLVIVVFFTLVAILSPVMAPYPYWEAHFGDAWQFPSAKYWFGTDSLGRDVLSRVIAGTRTSMLVATAVQAINLVIGVALGASAGFAGGIVDVVIMRVVDIIFSLPVLLFAILIVAALGSSLINLIMAMCITGWVGMAQLTRAQILYLREHDFVLAARVIGAKRGRIIVRHLLPNAIAPMIVSITLSFPNVVVYEAGLSFLGLGVSRDIPSWGRMIAEGNQNLAFYWHLALFPGLALALLIFGFAFLGDGLRDALDPHAR
jgi:ABC-type dipeptide/oligopeptide/nickel transport system permease subunit